ncbi:histone H2A-Bbd type 1-like [Sorex araneus]|uniref:histone H2A-Bbd type 1-like n=1 Tax=Sorex araneus TaxID=42254 RepID=UPI002433867E|nr:histone H2A-Bbd type 1-like [Sorex araneus]
MTGKKGCPFSHKPRKRAISRSTRAQLQFPVSRVDRLLRESQNVNRLSSSTPVFLAGVLEYLTANLLELAGQEAEKDSRSRITPEHLCAAVKKSLRVGLEDGTQDQAEMPQPSAGPRRITSNRPHNRRNQEVSCCCPRCHHEKN